MMVYGMLKLLENATTTITIEIGIAIAIEIVNVIVNVIGEDFFDESDKSCLFQALSLKQGQ